MESAVIEVHNLCRYFYLGGETVKALDGVTLQIPQATFFGITGPSGSGKSSLLYVLGGMDRPTSGVCRVLGRELSGLDDNQLTEFRGRFLGFVYQSFHLIPTMTAQQNVELPMVFSGVSSKERKNRALTLLEAIGLGDRARHRPHELSGGQQQRVAIARALANDPPVILADEPTGNLDSVTGQIILELFQKLVNEQRKTIVMISHDPAAIQATDQAVYLRDGQIQTADEISFGMIGEAANVC